MILNMTISGSSTKSTIIVSVETGSTVEAYSDSTYTTLVKRANEKSSGQYWITNLNNGTYYLKATLGADTVTAVQTITQYGVYRVTMIYRVIPEFTYTGTNATYKIVQDNGTEITNPATYQGNWKIRFLTSGTLNFSNLCRSRTGIDVFLVGGGGGGGYGGKITSGPLACGNGGAGGKTTTAKAIIPTVNTNYSIVVGAGGTGSSSTSTAAGAGGNSSAFGQTANGGGGGGKHSSTWYGTAGSGGSGGGAGGLEKGGKGGSNGGNGAQSSNTSGTLAGNPGTGQVTTTREFGESSGDLYAGGGSAGSFQGQSRVAGGDGGGGRGACGGVHSSNYNASAGTTNSGGGGGGGGCGYYGGSYDMSPGMAGGSGIVIIRNKR